MEGQGHMPPGTNLQKCDFCFTTFQTLSELICHSCIHAPRNPPSSDMFQAQNFLSKANFNNSNFANLDDIARHNRLHGVDKPTYNNYYDTPFTSSSQMTFVPQIPSAHQQIPPAHQQAPLVHQPIFTTEKGYSCNFRDANFAQQFVQSNQNDGGQSSESPMGYSAELFQNPAFTATKVPAGISMPKKQAAKDVDPSKPPAPRRKKGTGERNHKCYLCGKAFLKRSHLVEHLPIHTGERPFKCDICPQKFIKKSDLSRHTLTHTGEKPFKCDYCDAAYTRKSILRQHILIHTNEKPYKCNSCIAAFNKTQDLKQHMMIHTGEKPYKCDACEAAFTTKNQLKDHKATHTGEKLHKCILCGASFKRRKGLKRHHRIHTGKKPHQCEVCAAAFVEKSQMKVHMRIHTGEKPFKCDQCGAAFRQKGLLSIHQNIHLGQKQFPCDHCTASFSQKCNLTIHKRVHSGTDNFNQYLYQPSYTANRIQLNMLNKSKKMEINEATAKLLEELTPKPRKSAGEKNHKCSFCDAAFSRKNHLKEHMSIHTGEKPYSCNKCDSTFNKKEGLAQHKKIHTGDKPQKGKKSSPVSKEPFKCKYCTGMFQKKSDLEEHQVCHSGGQKNYVCETCDASFMSKNKLKEHKHLHNPSIKMYKCDICSAAFGKMSSLNRHSRSHADKTQYKCETCYAAFHNRDLLKVHLKTHTTFNPYPCTQCEASFAQKSQLKFHGKSHIGNKPYKCKVCTASFARKPSLVNHEIMHKRCAQEREFMEVKAEPEDEFDFAPPPSVMIVNDPNETDNIDSSMSANQDENSTSTQSSSSRKRKGQTTPRRVMKKKDEWEENMVCIKQEVEAPPVEAEEEKIYANKNEEFDSSPIKDGREETPNENIMKPIGFKQTNIEDKPEDRQGINSEYDGDSDDRGDRDEDMAERNVGYQNYYLNQTEAAGDNHSGRTVLRASDTAGLIQNGGNPANWEPGQNFNRGLGEGQGKDGVYSGLAKFAGVDNSDHGVNHVMNMGGDVGQTGGVNNVMQNRHRLPEYR